MTNDSATARWAYPTAALASLVVVAVIMQLWRAHLHVPFTYHAEALFNGMLVKGTLEQGWFLRYPALGAPGTLDLRDVPVSDNNLHFVVIRLLGLLSSDYALVMNLFFLLTFPLTAICALYVFRRFGFATGPALFGSLLYTFLPFHFSRGQHHLFLAAYYLVPLAVMVTLWIASGAVGLIEAGTRRWSWRWCRPQLIMSATVCVLLASSGTYYAFFACFLFLVAGALAALRGGGARALALPAVLVVATFAVLLANFWPSVAHVLRHGDTPAVIRSPVDADTYGLRISQLLMPVTGHRLPWVARVKDSINAHLRSNENDDASLGVIGNLGFLALMVRLVVPKRKPTNDAPSSSRVLGDLSLLNLSAVLLATIGGFGALVALMITSKIRAYNRISIYIAFFALFAVVAGLDHLYRAYGQGPLRQDLFAIGLTVLFVLGLLDQTSARMVPDYARLAADYRGDARFLQQLGTTMPQGAMIFQLPVIPFPEHPPVYRMQDYDHARAYLHASRLRWSYGAVKGRADEAWQAWVAAKPVQPLIETLVAAGFSGLYVNRDGYADWGVKVAADIAAALRQSPVSSGNQRLLFFDLRPYQAALRAGSTPAEWEERQESASHPLLMVWQNGCSDLEGTPQNNFRWCADAGEWRLVNGAGRARRVTLNMSFTSTHEGTLSLEGPLLSERFRVGPAPRALSKTMWIPPGQHRIHFGCDAPRVLPSGDRRHLVFRVNNLTITEQPPD